MARGDIQISLEDSDLRIEKSKNNSYPPYSWRHDSADNTVILSVKLPREFSPENINGVDWKSYLAPISSKELIDNTYDSSLVYVEYYYTKNNGLDTVLSKSQAILLEEDRVTYPNIQEYNELLSSLEKNQDLLFGFNFDEASGDNNFLIEAKVLGDFVVKDFLPQNEFVVMNASEGSFLQHPTFGVGLRDYIQSPTSSDELIQRVTNKLAQDGLRVIGINTKDGLLSVQSEEANNI
tara:strand:- start:270 stop:977 length:708 start_codon:yes stop_codon:yes gene_type:complete